MRPSPARLILVTLVAAAGVFCLVQDRVAVDGVRRYVELQRAADAGRGARVTIDAIVEPAVAKSVRAGLGSGGAVLAAGFSGAAIVALRSRRG